MSDLTDKQRQFVQEYLIDLNATKAAIRAGYSQDTARSIASENLSKPDIQDAIQIAMEERAKRTQITQDRVLTEIGRIAFFDPRRLYHEDGTPIEISQLDDTTAAALAGLDVDELFDGNGDDRKQIGVTKKYKIANKIAALELAARHLGMLNDKLKVSGTLGAGITINVKLD